MKRRSELVNLSREHNRALFMARAARLAARDGDDAAVHEAWAALARSYDEEMREHFLAEERLIFPLVTQAGGSALVERLLREHRAMVRCIESRELWTRERLDAMGDILHDHVRCEERQVYPLFEEHATAALFAAVATHPALSAGG